MAKQRSDQCKYQSRYADDTWVTAAQYITELVCEKKAQNERKELPQKFWNLPEWKKFFAMQVLAANELLKIYPAKAVILALNDGRTKKMFSLRFPALDAVIEEYKKKIEREERELAGVDKMEVSDTATTTKPRTPFKKSKKSILSKLENVDGEEKSK